MSRLAGSDRRVLIGGLAALAVGCLAAADVRAQGQGKPADQAPPPALKGSQDLKLSAAEQPAVLRGLTYLRGRVDQGQVGESAMIALAMINSDVPKNDPAFSQVMGRVLSRFQGSTYTPDRSGGTEIYEAGVIAMVLSELDSSTYRPQIDAVAQYLIRHQNPNGSWDYQSRNQGDSSITQYALLGLWAAEESGVDIPPSVWDQAAGWYMSVQSSAGSWNYHRDEGASYPETLSMTAAGVGSLMLCNRQLGRYRKNTDAPNPLLIPLVAEGGGQKTKYKPTHAAADVQGAANRGMAWIGRNWKLGTGEVVGRTPYYFLYAMERIGALVGSNRESVGGIKWFDEGKRFVQSTQKSEGAWTGDYGTEVNTAYAILFLTRATARKIRKIEIKRLGAGTLLGGRGLPKDLSSLTVAGGRVVVRPMNGAVEGMLAVLEDPRSENADSALAGLVERYQTGGSRVLKPHKDRFRKLLLDPDAGVRRVAAWALGRMGDLDVVPLLVNAMKRAGEDDSVVSEVRNSLQFLSRKIDGFGPPSISTPDQRHEAAKRWLDWYNAIRPIDQDALIADEGPAVPPPPPAASGDSRADGNADKNAAATQGSSR